MKKLIFKLIPNSLSKRTALLISSLAFATVLINMVVIFFFEYSSSFSTAEKYIDSQHKIMSSDLAESIITDDIYSLFTMIETVSQTIPHIDNIAVFGADGEYMTDARVRPENLTSTISPITLTKQISAGENILGKITFYINRESIIRQITGRLAELFLINIVVVIMGALTGVAIAARMTKPINDLSRQIANLDVLELPYKFSISEYASGETRNLRNVIEKLSYRLKDSIDRIGEQQKEIHRGERLAYLGTMSAGLAHELKNPIMAISLIIDNVSAEVEDNSQWQEDFAVIRREADRLVFRLNEFLDYSKPVNLRYDEIRLSALIEFIKGQTYRKVFRSLDIVFAAESDPQIAADKDKVSQIFTILLNNSAEAGASKILCSFGETEDSIDIEYEDDGCGFKEEDIAKVMLPFYTTKPTGSGLGLAICATIADAMGASVKISEKQSRGAKFVIKLPKRPLV
ncbi:HAMP domain-containing sensor histidine kinase [Seleniivibrio woodruffii]|uniref:sensor histidine kinase n=1 Tax=Seleniivibrio woodruffii TaxID=1078050 RepID=UPI0026EF6610|nr:HAMP domain-containing sensor histidine kinase [Seleniivibrio woodruffii]